MAKKDVVLNIIAKTDEFERKLRETGRYTEKQAQVMGRKWERALVDSQIKAGKAAQKSASTAKIAWGSALGVLSAGAIKQAAAELLAFTQDMADYRNEISDAAVRTGLAAESIAGLRLAAKGSGLGLQELNGALLKFSKMGGDANENLDDFLVKLDTFETASEKAAFASKTLGEETGPKLLQALGGSGEALKKFTEFARDYGTDVGPKASDEAGRYQRMMAALEEQLKGTAAELVGFNNITDTTIATMTAIGALGIRVAGIVDTMGESFRVGALGWQLIGTTASAATALMMGNEEAARSVMRAMTEFGKAQQDLVTGSRFTEFVETGDAALSRWRASIKGVIETSATGGGGGGLEEVAQGVEAIGIGAQFSASELEKLFGAEAKWLADNKKLRDEIRDDDVKQDEDWAEAEKKRKEEELERERALTAAKFDLAHAFADGAVAITNALTAKTIEGQRRIAIAQKAAALFSIGVSTAEAIMSALTLPPPASFVAAAAVGVAGAVQAGIVASKPLPKLHNGGEVNATLLQGEGVINRRAMQQIGPQALDAINNGTGGVPQGPVQAMVALNDRLVDRLGVRMMRMDGGASRMMRGGAVATRAPYR